MQCSECGKKMRRDDQPGKDRVVFTCDENKDAHRVEVIVSKRVDQRRRLDAGEQPKQDNCGACGRFMTTYVDEASGKTVQLCRACLTIGLPAALRKPASTAALEEDLTKLRQAVGLATTLKPDLVMNVDDPVGMMQAVVEHVRAQLAPTGPDESGSTGEGDS